MHLFASSRHTFTALVFFLSGASALIYQVVWQRVLTQAIGVDSLAIAFIVTIFMIGLGFGALVGGGVSRSFPQHLPIIYAAIEFAIGIFGLLSIDILRDANAYFATFGVESLVFDFAANCALLVAPTFLMGMTTPVIIDFLRDRVDNFGRTIGLFYGLNVAGAALGSTTSLFLIELLGLNGVTQVAAVINMFISISFFVLALQIRSRAPRPNSGPSSIRQQNPSVYTVSARLQVASFLFGFASLSVQMVLLRVLVFFFSPTSFVFPIGLSAFLLLMTTGQMIGGHLVDRSSENDRWWIPIYLTIATVVAIIIVLNVPLTWLDNVRPSVTKNLYFLPFAALISLFIMIPAMFTSAFLPVVSRIALQQIEDSGMVFGRVLFWSTVGNIVGSFLTAIVLFDVFGSVKALVLILIILFTGSFIVMPVRSADVKAILRRKDVVVPIGSCILGFIMFFPFGYFGQARSGNLPFVQMIGATKPVFVMEGHSTVTPIYENQKGVNRYEVRPFNAGAAAAIRDTNSVFYQYYSLAVSQIVDPSFRPKRILLIGLGSGELPFVMRELPFVEEFVVVELAPEVMDAYVRFSDPKIAETTKHPKIRVEVMDGRRYVEMAAMRGEKFDLVQVGILGLTLAGASNIYSADFFQSLKGLLNPGGYLALEPYIGVARIGFDILPYGYVLPGSSWLFLHEKPLGLKTASIIAIDDLQSNLYSATSFGDLRAAGTKKAPCGKIEFQIIEFNKDDVMRLFPNLFGTDDRLIFEYFYLAELRKDFVWPVTKIYDIPTIPRNPVSATACPTRCGGLCS